MSFDGLQNEDAYWENYREEYEHGFRPRSEWAKMDAEPEYEAKSLYLDEEGQTEELEAEFGCRMEDLDDDDLIEIVERFTKDHPDEDSEIKWDPNMWSIDYKIKIA